MSEKQYVIDNKELISEWDWEKNNAIGLKPQKLSCGSHAKAFWICKKHNTKYCQVIRDKVRGQLTCKLCYEEREFEPRRKRYIGNKPTLAETHPHLVNEWIVCEDIRITPYNCVANTNKKVLWKCKKCGGEYKTYIYNRAFRGSGCPYCAGQAVLQGYNDLETTNPELSKEWSNKNKLTAKEVTQFSNKKVYWMCPLGHEDYLMSIKQRSNGSGCPTCALQSQTSFPEQALFFYIKKVFPDVINRFVFEKKYEIDIYIPSKNLGIEYNGYYSHKGKEKKDKEKKELFHKNGISLLVVKEYKKDYEKNDADFYVHQRTNTKDLNILINDVLNFIFGNVNFNIDVAKDMISIKEQYVVKKQERSIANLRPDLLSEWDYKNNGKITPDLVTIGSKLEYAWICPICHETYYCSPKNKCKGASCPKHRKVRVLNFASEYPDLLKFWDFEKNKENPYEVYCKSTKIFNWVCDKGHKYTSSIANRVRGKHCPICTGKRILAGFNDLLSQNPELAKEWDYDLNTLTPKEIHFRSQTPVHWICNKCGHRWKSKVINRKECPNCKYQKIAINVYNLIDLSYYGTFKNTRALCEHFGIDINKQHGNISSICRRKQKSLFGKYVLRHPFDDEFKNQ